MDTDTLIVKFFGDMSLTWNGNSIYSTDNRSKKSWLLLAYLLYNRTRSVSQREIIRVLWEFEDKSSNPSNALKTLLHRTRSMVNELGDQLGHQLIQFKDGMYSISGDVKISSDYEVFEKQLRRSGELSGSDKIGVYKEALDVYTGDFLSSFSLEQWVVPISVHYHDLFVSSALDTAAMLFEGERYEECRDVCLKAIDIEQYDEELYLMLLRSYDALGNKKELCAAYEKLKTMLYSNFGTLPSDECSALYRNAYNTVSSFSMPFEDILDQMHEDHGTSHKAVVCDYDLFRFVYRIGARQIVRSGDVIHVALFTVLAKEGKNVTKKSMDKAMDNLEIQLGANLRAGDIIARCSSTQFVVMLAQANYESSQMVCGRLVSAFNRKYPHSPVEITYEVRGLAPRI